MPVVCLTYLQKCSVASLINKGELNKTEIAEYLGVSRRTIGRVLKELKAQTVVKPKQELSLADVLVYLCNLTESKFNTAVRAVTAARNIKQLGLVTHDTQNQTRTPESVSHSQ